MPLRLGWARGMTLDELMRQAREAGVDRLDAQCLAAHHLGRTRSWVLAHGDEPLAEPLAQALRESLNLRSRGTPLAYLTGEREFHGLTLHVTPDTLIPRPDTETLVDWALERLRGSGVPAPQVLDLGTGSGAIALAIRHAHPAARVWAVDNSPAALEVARGNGHRLGLPVQWCLGDWFGPVAGLRFDLIVSNPPYIDAADPHLRALQCEPLQALSPGADSTAALRQIIRTAPAFLKPGGWLLLEHGYDQGPAVRRALQDAGFAAPSTRQDLGGQPRCSGGAWQS